MFNYAVGFAVVILLTVVLGIISPSVFPANDPYALVRYLMLRVVNACWGTLLLVGGLLFIDHITPHQWLEKIYDSPIACSIVITAILYTIGNIFLG